MTIFSEIEFNYAQKPSSNGPKSVIPALNPNLDMSRLFHRMLWTNWVRGFLLDAKAKHPFLVIIIQKDLKVGMEIGPNSSCSSFSGFFYYSWKSLLA